MCQVLSSRSAPNDAMVTSRDRAAGAAAQPPAERQGGGAEPSGRPAVLSVLAYSEPGKQLQRPMSTLGQCMSGPGCKPELQTMLTSLSLDRGQSLSAPVVSARAVAMQMSTLLPLLCRRRVDRSASSSGWRSSCSSPCGCVRPGLGRRTTAERPARRFQVILKGASLDQW